MPPKKVVLPTKERALFARLLNEYETKKPKLGLKTADSILKKFPDHGETLAMKGLLLFSNFHKKEEGMALAKKGLMFDLTSFICWHVLGIMHRGDKNFVEALKCYQQGLRIEPTNIQLLRESCVLSTQLRDYDSLINIRTSLLRMQSHMRSSYISLAVAHQLAGNVRQASRIMSEFETIIRDVPARSFDHSEVVLYQASLLEEEKNWKALIQFIDSRKENEVLDRKSWDEMKGRCLIELGEKSKAENIFTSLLKRNGEQRSYLEGFLRSRDVEINATSPEAKENAGKCFSELQTKFPKSTAAKRLALQYVSGETFKTQVQSYILNAFQKGIPSIFSDLKPLYNDIEKREAIESIVKSFIEEWSPKSTSSSEEESEPPSSLLWALYFLSQHYSKIDNHSQALETINLAISHSPSMPELSMTRGRILKRAGDLKGAVDSMEDARLLDGQDRFLNCKTAKYNLRVGNLKEANRLIGLFTRPEAPSPVEDLLEMQAFWYLGEEAKAWELEGNLAMALKRLFQIEKTFDDMYDDQLDFHSYCMRTFTLRSYVDMIRFEDQLRSQDAYFKAALQAIQILTRLHDDPSLKKPAPAKEADVSQLSEAERKAAKKAKKAEAKKAEEAEKLAAAKKAEAEKLAKAKASKNEDDEAPPPPKDEDPEGTKVMQNLKEPLVVAERFLLVLGQRADKRIETWLATFEVAIRQKNWLLCARALSQAYALDSSNPDLHVQIVKFKNQAADISTVPEPIREALSAAVPTFYPEESLSLEQFNSTYSQKYPNSAEHILASAKGLMEIRGGRGKEDAVQLVIQCTKEENQASLETLLKSQSFLASISPESLESFNASSLQLYPFSNAFSTSEKLKKEEEIRRKERESWEEKPDTDGTGVAEVA